MWDCHWSNSNTISCNPFPPPSLSPPPQMPLDLLKLASCWDSGRMGGTGSLAVQIGGLQMQGAAFDGTRFSELTQVRGGAEGRQLGRPA